MTWQYRLFGWSPLARAKPALLLVWVVGLQGCDGQAKRSPREGTAGVRADDEETRTIASNEPARNGAQATAGVVRDSRTKWIGNIPYDVWFDRPLDVYRDNTPLAGGATVPDIPDPMPPTSPAGTDATGATVTPAAANTGAGASAIDWGAVAPVDVLLAESKDIRVRLTANLQTVATFNKSWKGVATDGAILAAVAAVVERTPGDVNWKDKSKHIRDLAYQVYAVEGTGREQYEKAQIPFDKIVAMLDGGPPPDTEAADKAPFADSVSRTEMMRRIDASFTWLKSDINTATRLKEDQEKTIHEATLLRMLGTIFGDDSYEFSEEPEFREFVQAFVDGNAAVIKAANEGNFADFEAARSRIQSTCDPCHQKYRNSSN